MARAEAYLHAKFDLDPSNRLATVHQRHRQTDRTGQTDNGLIAQGRRTVLQTVAQNGPKSGEGLHPLCGEEELDPHLTQCGQG